MPLRVRTASGLRVNRVDVERGYWDEASRTPPGRLRNEWLCDRSISDEACVGVIAQFLDRAVDLDSPVTLIDLGCGPGRVAVPLADRFPRVIVEGVDSSPGMLARAVAHPRVRYTLGDGRGVPVTGDAVYTMGLLQHVPVDGQLGYVGAAGRAAPVLVAQFIEGEEAEPFSHHIPLNMMVDAASAAGYGRVSVSRGVLHPLWTWMVAWT